MTADGGDVAGSYLALGLALGRHVEGLVDAYYGPPELARQEAAGTPHPPQALAGEARALLAELDAGVRISEDEPDDPARRRWLRAQVLGLLTTARRLAGEEVGYIDEIEQCYGVRPSPVPEERFAEAHRQVAEALPGSGPLTDRLIAWRESHAVDPDVLPAAISSLAEELRQRTDTLFGLPDGEHIEFQLVTNKPWSGFNWYLGDLRSRVDVNTDLPVLSTSLAHLVAHEAYPGHHTEHSRKEVGLVRRRHYQEETIFLVGTPSALLAEGLADLGIEVVMGRRHEQAVAAHLQPLGIRYDTEVVAAVSEAADALASVRGNAALKLHDSHEDPDVVIDWVAHWGMLPRVRAAKAVEFLMHPTWRAYVFCYIEGLRLCRQFVGGEPARFGRLLTEQLTPAELGA